MRTACQNGNVVEHWYDRKTRSSVTQVHDANGREVGEPHYSGNRGTAKSTRESIIASNGGPAKKAKVKYSKVPEASKPKETIGRKSTRKFYEAHFSRQGAEEWYRVRPERTSNLKEQSESIEECRELVKHWLAYNKAQVIDVGGLTIKFPKSSAKYDIRILHVEKRIEVIDFIEAK